MYHETCKVEFQSFNRWYSQLTFLICFQKLLVPANATTAVLTSPYLCGSDCSLVFTSSPAQLLYIASEIALALLAHPVAAAGLRGDFSDRQSALLACERRAGTNRDASNLVGSQFVRVIFVDFDHAASASGNAALLLLLPRIGFCYC